MKDRNEILEKVIVIAMPVIFGLVFGLIAMIWYRSSQTRETADAKTAEAAVQQAVQVETQPVAETEMPQTEDVEYMLADMSLSEKVAQMFIITPEALTGIESVVAAGESTKTAYERYPVGGLVYFDNNLESEEQLRTMLANMYEISQERMDVPAFLSVDEEGGAVARVAGNDAFSTENQSSMLSIGNTGDEQQAYAAGAYIGEYLKDYGFNLDYAPVADVIDSEENTVIGSRSFGTDPETVGNMVKKAVEGFKSQGMLTSLKHFPGHGATAEDSHLDYAYNNKTKEELENSEWIPFKKGIEAGADMVMVGHISVPGVTGSDAPSSLSEKVVTGILRDEFEFDGIVITDAMNMGAIANNYSSKDAAVSAVLAGVDILLMPYDFVEAYEGVVQAVEADEISEERIDESVRRILRVKMQL